MADPRATRLQQLEQLKAQAAALEADLQQEEAEQEALNTKGKGKGKVILAARGSVATGSANSRAVAKSAEVPTELPGPSVAAQQTAAKVPQLVPQQPADPPPAAFQPVAPVAKRAAVPKKVPVAVPVRAAGTPSEAVVEKAPAPSAPAQGQKRPLEDSQPKPEAKEETEELKEEPEETPAEPPAKVPRTEDSEDQAGSQSSSWKSSWNWKPEKWTAADWKGNRDWKASDKSWKAPKGRGLAQQGLAG